MRQRLNRTAVRRYTRMISKYQSCGLTWEHAIRCTARRMGWAGNEAELQQLMTARTVRNMEFQHPALTIATDQQWHEMVTSLQASIYRLVDALTEQRYSRH